MLAVTPGIVVSCGAGAAFPVSASVSKTIASPTVFILMIDLSNSPWSSTVQQNVD
jgi:hypothetical protein